MATDVKQLDVLKRVWVCKSLELQKSALMRSRNKEIPGSEIYGLRTREIQFLEDLIKEYQS